MKRRGRYTAKHDVHKGARDASAPSSRGGHRGRGPTAGGGSHRGRGPAAGAHYRKRSAASARRRKLAWACAGIGVAAVLVACAAFLPRAGVVEVPSAQTQSEVAAEDPWAAYSRAVSLVNQADETIVPLSKLVSKTLDDELASQIEKTLAGSDAARALLDEAQSCLQGVSGSAGEAASGGTASGEASDDLQEHAATLSDAIEARGDMLLYGGIVLDASVGAYRASDDVVALWQDLIDGHDELQKASGLLGSGTTKSLKAALKHDRRALAHFQAALEHVDAVAQAAPKVDLSVERDYANLQVQAAQAAIQTDQALLGEDAKRAQAHNSEYHEHSQAAAEKAEELPASTDDLVKSIYYSLGTDDISVKDAENEYNAASKRAAKDDKALAARDGGGGTSKES